MQSQRHMDHAQQIEVLIYISMYGLPTQTHNSKIWVIYSFYKVTRLSPLVSSLGCVCAGVHPCTSPLPPFLLMQNLSPEDIAGCDIMKLNMSGCIYMCLVVIG